MRFKIWQPWLQIKSIYPIFTNLHHSCQPKGMFFNIQKALTNIETSGDNIIYYPVSLTRTSKRAYHVSYLVLVRLGI